MQFSNPHLHPQEVDRRPPGPTVEQQASQDHNEAQHQQNKHWQGTLCVILGCQPNQNTGPSSEKVCHKRYRPHARITVQTPPDEIVRSRQKERKDAADLDMQWRGLCWTNTRLCMRLLQDKMPFVCNTTCHQQHKQLRLYCTGCIQGLLHRASFGMWTYINCNVKLVVPVIGHQSMVCD